MNTKEQIKAAASKRFKTETVDLGEGVSVTLRELSRNERKALDVRLWETNPDGSFKKDDKDFLIPKPGMHYTEEWLAACMVPQMTVEELLDDAWPSSLKEELRQKAQVLCGIDLKTAMGN